VTVSFSSFIQLDRLNSSVVLSLALMKVGVPVSSQAMKSSFDVYSVTGPSQLLVTFMVSDLISQGFTLNSCFRGDIDRLADTNGMYIEKTNIASNVLVMRIVGRLNKYSSNIMIFSKLQDFVSFILTNPQNNFLIILMHRIYYNFNF
jgi:hypothetical protein